MPCKFILPSLALALLLAGCHGVSSPPPPLADRTLEVGTFDGGLLSAAIAREVNRVRGTYGLAALASNRNLDLAADEQASHLVLVAAVEHSNFMPGEETPRARVAREGMFPALVGENALMMPISGPALGTVSAYSYTAFAALLVDGWMNSPGHRANILDRDFEVAGISSRLGRSPRTGTRLVYAVQVFIRSALPGDQHGT